MKIDKLKVLTEIKGFLDGYNNELKYLVHVETDPDDYMADCVIHEPGKDPEIRRIKYTPFMYMKDLSLNNLELYSDRREIYENKKIQYGITITKLKTGNHKRLKNGYCYKLTSSKSYNAIIDFLKDGRIYPYEKLRDEDGEIVFDAKGDPIYLYRDMYFSPRLTEQFFISTQSRLFKGIEEYKNVRKVTFDCETTGLRYQRARLILIGVRSNWGFETILEAKQPDDDDSERNLIQDFFNLIIYLQPAIVSGFNSEEFDFEFILGRAKELKMDLTKIPTSLRKGTTIKRRPNVSVKYGNTTEKFTATEMWGISIIDIIHAVRKTAAVNSEIKASGLKYIAKHEKIARPNRTYIPGEDNSIGRYYNENKIFLVDEKNNFIQIPDEFQTVARNFYKLQANKSTISDLEYRVLKKKEVNNAPEFIKWFKREAQPKNLNTFIGGKKLVKNYLLDDLWETEQVDELYNQSAFLLAKIIPTTYQRVCTMGTAGIWNLLMTAWSYEKDLAIPYSDVYERYVGGLARCYKIGFNERIIKIDYAGLYPSIQLTEDVFPNFDITGAMRMMLLYFTTTRNIYKKLANSTDLNAEEIELFKQIDPEMHHKFINKEFTSADIAMFKIKQLPIKILNNSQYGAFGSNVSFNWSDNICAARITCTARLHLRHAINWFSQYGCIALLAVTDGINFKIPNKTNIGFNDNGEVPVGVDCPIETAWKYNGKTGIAALIEKYNKEEMKPPFMSVDNDGEYISCLNLSRINYATLANVKDKKTGETKEKVKLTGNTIKSKVMPEYIEEFIDKGFALILHGKGKEFVDYYYSYVQDIYYKQIPLKKIATKNRIKTSLNAYKKRGKDKNGREKGKQAHMELLIEKREKIAKELFEKYKADIQFTKDEEKLTPDDKLRLVATYMPPEPALDSVVYQVNTGYIKSDGSSKRIKDKETGEMRYASTLISAEELLENPNLTGYYNITKYLDAFNSRVSSILAGFDEEVCNKMLSKIKKIKTKDEFGNKVVTEELTPNINEFEPDKLVLKSFDSDIFEESMFLEEMEVEFWNKTGYDPRLIWNGFSMSENYKVYYEIYEGALKYLNDLMLKSGKPLIKSINDTYEKGDLVLIKDGSQYHVGIFNGIIIGIIKENVSVPKTEIELELDKKREEQQEKIKNLETLGAETERDKHLKAKILKREKYFEGFKREFRLPAHVTMEKLFVEEPSANTAFENYIFNMENQLEQEAAEYQDEDEDGMGDE
jgi:DNA polymerase elongation subunit (family B)